MHTMAKAKLNFLSLQEENDLGWKIYGYRNQLEGYSEADCKEAMNILFENNKLGVYKIVSRFYATYKCQSYYPREEANADAILAFMEFIRNKYDPTRGLKVLTGATWHVYKKLQVCSDLNRPIPMKSSGYKYNDVCRVLNEYEELGISKVSKLDYLKEKLPQYKEDDLISLLNLRKGVSSLNFTVHHQSEDRGELEVFIEDKQTNRENTRMVNQEFIDDILSSLPEMEMEALRVKYELNEKYADEQGFRKAYNLKKSEFNIIVKSALSKLKEICEEMGVNSYA